MDDRLLTIADVMELLGISKMTLYRMFRDGELDRVKVRGQVRIPEWSLQAYLRKIGAAQPQEGGSPCDA